MRKTIVILLWLVSSLSMHAQMKMQDVVKLMPDSIVPYLTENNVLDFIDFMDSNLPAEITNRFGCKSKMIKLTDRYTLLQLNEASKLEMCLLDVNTTVDSLSQIICLVRTYGTDFRISTIDFYSLKWRKLDADSYIELPEYICIATLDEQEPILTLTPNLKLEAPANEEQKEVEESSIILNWKGKFVKQS